MEATRRKKSVRKTSRSSFVIRYSPLVRTALKKIPMIKPLRKTRELSFDDKSNKGKGQIMMVCMMRWEIEKAEQQIPEDELELGCMAQ